MLNKIIQLDKDISNKIAAGEVVERPLAVVKELVENAIDAHATKITVEIKNAGKSLIRVTDNGHGIAPEEVVLAFERHSTSKIRTINDIYHISSLGFRGEALASIASVSNMEVITKYTTVDYGKKLVLSGGKIIENLQVGAPDGTTMMVKDLFFNTPARLKFMKSNNAEQSAINDIMTKLALSHPEVAFKYIVSGENMFITPGNGKLYDVILNIYQRQISKNLIEVNFEENGIKLEGFISSLDISRGNRQYQIAFVNHRYVKSKTVEEAIGTVYRTLIPHNRFPITFLNIQLDPSLIDINIHPSKTEIRFHQEGVVKDLIYKALRYEINRYDMTPEKPLNSKPIENKAVLETYHEENKKVNTIKTPVSSPRSENIETREIREKTKVLLDSYKKIHEEPVIKERTKSTYDSVKPSQPLKREPLVREPVIKSQVHEVAQPLLATPEETIYDHLNFIGQIFNSYLIYEKQGQMYMIDQHAAHEKILYEKFIEDFRTGNMMTQMILEPIVVNVSKMVMQHAMSHEVLFKRLGFYIEPFGEEALVVREIPAAFNMKTAKALIHELVETLDFSLPSEQFEMMLDSLASKACKAAIKANDKLMTIEVQALIDSLKTLNDPYTCPHGRPIIIKISRHEIEKKFNRT